jgi:hypothetical protein
MRLGALFGWGIVIFAVSALANDIMVAYGLVQDPYNPLVNILILFMLCIIAASSLKDRKWSDILPYSIGWALVSLAISALFIAPSGNWNELSGMNAWALYACIVIFPLFAVFFRNHARHAGFWET